MIKLKEDMNVLEGMMAYVRGDEFDYDDKWIRIKVNREGESPKIV